MRRRLPIRRLAATALALALVGAALLAAPASPEAPRPLIDDAEPRVTVALSPSELTVGDRIDAVLTVSAPESELAGPPRFPDWESHWGTAEILEVRPPETLEPRAGVAGFRQKLVLTAFRPGEVALPARGVEVPLARGTVRVATPAELTFEISPVLPPPAEQERDDPPALEAGGSPTDGETPDLELRPEEPPRGLPLTRAFWVATGALGAACFALGLLLWRQIRTPGTRPEDLTPLFRLQRDLDALADLPSVVDAHAGLSRALRHYLARELGFPAPESTTTEIRRTLAARRVPEAVHRDAGEVLAACDLVKFARRGSTTEVLRRRIGTVRRMGRRLDEHLHTPEPHSPGLQSPGPHSPGPHSPGSHSPGPRPSAHEESAS